MKLGERAVVPRQSMRSAEIILRSETPQMFSYRRIKISPTSSYLVDTMAQNSDLY